MKAFDIQVPQNYTHCVYFLNEEIILVNDKRRPFPKSQRKWVKDSNTFIGYSHSTYPDKLSFPTYIINKMEINDFLSIHLVELFKYYLDFNELIYNNVLILTKYWDEELEVGIGIHTGNYSVIHEFGQKVCDSYLNLKSFW